MLFFEVNKAVTVRKFLERYVQKALKMIENSETGYIFFVQEFRGRLKTGILWAPPHQVEIPPGCRK